MVKPIDPQDSEHTPGVPAKALQEDSIPNESGTIDPLEPRDAEKLKNLRNTQPVPEDNIGRDTVGQGQPNAQKVKQQESLPATNVPVEKNFSKTGEFYDPMKDERALAKKDAGARGGNKPQE